MRRPANIGCLQLDALVAAWIILAASALLLSAMSQVGADEFDDAILYGSDGEASSQVDDSSCDWSCCDFNCCPRWTARAGFIALERAQSEGSVLVSDAVTLAPLINANSFAFGYEPGFDVSLIRHGADFWDVELRYFQNDAWNPGFWAFTPNTTVEINGAIPTFIGVAGPVAMRAMYDSDLLSAEFNLRHSPNESFTWLVGFRYLEIDEDLRIIFDEPLLVAPVVYDVITRNRLYGAQLGAELNGWTGERLEWGLGVKGGIFCNAAAQGSFINTGVVLDTAFGAGNIFSVLGEASASLNYHIGPRWSLRGTYSVWGINGLALSSDQVTVTDFIAGTGFDDNSNVLYHGAFLGLEYSL